MTADFRFLLLIWFNGVLFGLLAALLADRIGARRPRRPKATDIENPAVGFRPGKTPISRKTPKETAYPEPETAESARDTLPRKDELPPVAAGGIEWAWADAKHRRGSVVAVPAEELENDKAPTFVLGDLHGDVLSLRRILAYVRGVHPRSRVVFLGDLVDRAGGPEMLECARLFIWAARQRPGMFLWIRGNHDYLARNAETGRFCTSVEPHDFCDFLNERPDLAQEGEALGEIMSVLPVGAVLGNVWLSHGGVIQDDEVGLRSFSGFAAMTDEMKRDLVWTRMRDVPSKLAFRGSAGAEAGLRQAEAFVRRVGDAESIAISHVVCAHQHEAREGVAYMPFNRCFTHGITCQCIASFSARGICPAILRLDGTNTPVTVYFPGKIRNGCQIVQ